MIYSLITPKGHTMKKLSNIPGTIRTQISRSETSIAHFEGELTTTPHEDPRGRQVIQQDLDAEREILGRLKSHLDALEVDLIGGFDSLGVATSGLMEDGRMTATNEGRGRLVRRFRSAGRRRGRHDP